MILFVDPLSAAAAQHHQLAVARRNVRQFADTGVRVLNPSIRSPVSVVM